MTAHEDILKEARRIDTSGAEEASPPAALPAIPLESPGTTQHSSLEPVRRFVSENPGPAVLIGAGLAWLFVNRERKRTRSLPTRMKDRAHNLKESTSQSYHEAKLSTAHKMEHAREVTSEKLDHAKEVTSEKLSHARDVTSEKLMHAREATALKMDEAKQFASQKAEAARMRYNSMLQDNPLALGACAVAAGLALGLLFPSTRRENELMGEARDSLMDQALAIVNEARAAALQSLRSNREAVEEKLHEVKDEVEGAVRESVHEAKQTFKHEIEKEDL